MSIPVTANSLGAVHKVSKATTFSLKDNILNAFADKLEKDGIDSTLYIKSRLDTLEMLLKTPEPNLDTMAKYISDLHIILDTIQTRYGISDNAIDEMVSDKLIDLAGEVF